MHKTISFTLDICAHATVITAHYMYVTVILF